MLIKTLKSWGVGLLVLLTAGLAQAQTLERVDPDAFQAAYETGQYQVIDVRTPEEFAEGRIFEDAELINFYGSDFAMQLSALDKSQPYLIYCRSGNRSGRTLALMRDLGFQHVIELQGGKRAWERSGRTLIR